MAALSPDNRLVVRVLVCLLMAAVSLAGRPDAPPASACTAASRGRFWPERANSDAKLARELAQCGELQVCAAKMWHYRWQPVSVNIRQLGKTPQAPTAACIAWMAQAAESPLAGSTISR